MLIWELMLQRFDKLHFCEVALWVSGKSLAWVESKTRSYWNCQYTSWEGLDLFLLGFVSSSYPACYIKIAMFYVKDLIKGHDVQILLCYIIQTSAFTHDGVRQGMENNTCFQNIDLRMPPGKQCQFLMSVLHSHNHNTILLVKTCQLIIVEKLVELPSKCKLIHELSLFAHAAHFSIAQ